MKNYRIWTKQNEYIEVRGVANIYEMLERLDTVAGVKSDDIKKFEEE